MLPLVQGQQRAETTGPLARAERLELWLLRNEKLCQLWAVKPLCVPVFSGLPVTVGLLSHRGQVIPTEPCWVFILTLPGFGYGHDCTTNTCQRLLHSSAGAPQAKANCRGQSHREALGKAVPPEECAPPSQSTATC